MRILIIEDEQALARNVAKGLNEEGFAVDMAIDGEEGLHMATTYDYDAIVLDLMLPKVEGLEILQRLRERESAVPVLILTARSALEDRLEGFRSGTDDYVTKPFAFAELVARLQALVRRGHGVAGRTLHVGSLEMDLDAHTAAWAGQMLDLTATEYGLLECLALKQGKVVSRTELTEHLWSHDAEKLSNVLDVHVANLRRKINPDEGKSLIQTVRGAGYVLSAVEQ